MSSSVWLHLPGVHNAHGTLERKLDELHRVGLLTDDELAAAGAAARPGTGLALDAVDKARYRPAWEARRGRAPIS